ncbi:hypothetical protein I7I53_07788 [Histoplasma capsulatum var. duboisii H88]|uniref:Uncharacterized protein n=1 Tax=Ajellomyces capsulatus (strain H88) TaxID=544711 RepID=A0A8A1LF97_AJEC8|nr:hypothetical protein I7I53_07788 [Histoplasma capsulatum var. duboisii H88]
MRSFAKMVMSTSVQFAMTETEAPNHEKEKRKRKEKKIKRKGENHQWSRGVMDWGPLVDSTPEAGDRTMAGLITFTTRCKFSDCIPVSS